MDDYSGQVVLVAGAGWKPGRQVAMAFAARGAKVAVSDLTPVNLDGIVDKIRTSGETAEIFTADISSKIQAQTMITSVLEHWGRIDALVVIIGVRPKAPLLELDEWDWRRALDVNLTGPFLMAQVTGRVMRDLGGGSILFIADRGESEDAYRTRAAFAAGRSGLAGFTRAAAPELSPHRIRINAVLRSTGATSPAKDPPGGGSRLAGVNSLPEAAVLLCSPESPEITGQVFEIR